MSHRHSRRIPRPPLARYANYFEVGHNACEFLLDFGQFRPESSDVALHTRIAIGPIHAKLLAEMLQNAVSQHEADHGTIPELTEPQNPLEVLLRSLPDFERRALEARRNAVASSITAADPNPTPKR